MIKVFVIFLLSINSFSLYAQNFGTETGLKLPRYVTLKSNDSNHRKEHYQHKNNDPVCTKIKLTEITTKGSNYYPSLIQIPDKALIKSL